MGFPEHIEREGALMGVPEHIEMEGAHKTMGFPECIELDM